MSIVCNKSMSKAESSWFGVPVELPDEFNSSNEKYIIVWPEPVGYRIAKRILDISVASILLILSVPILVIAAVAIKLTSRGPVIFKQYRAGYLGRPFMMYKLRTMTKDVSEDTFFFNCLEGRNGPAFKLKRDPRITPVGRWLRKTSIDELPQLVNVILGTMSLVGPRPLPLEQVRLESIEERARLSVKPGITGLWQVSGRADVPYSEWVEMDLYYVQHKSVWLDILILLRTFPEVLSCEGAY